jgi:alanine racemase
VHLNINTGMNRLGILPEELGNFLNCISNGNTVLEGAFTHLSSADCPGTETVRHQYGRFDNVLGALAQAGRTPEVVHVSNSAGLLRFTIPPKYRVRPGILLYGCKPDPAQDFGISLLPVASLKAGVIKIQHYPSGTPVSYGGTYITPHDMLIATVPIGYAHGLPRSLSNTGTVLIGGKRCRVIGRVTMDYIMVDIHDNPHVSIGDEVVAMGSQGNETITADEIALQSGTIAYEILCGLCNRINRIWVKNGVIIHHEPQDAFQK